MLNVLECHVNFTLCLTGFNLQVEHPHSYVVKTTQLVRGLHRFVSLKWVPRVTLRLCPLQN